MAHGMSGKGDKGGHPENLKMPGTTRDKSQSAANKAAGSAKGNQHGGGRGGGKKGKMDY